MGDRVQDFCASSDSAANRSADLAGSDPATIRNRYFQETQFGSRRLNLHFDGPAEVAVFHLQLAKTLVIDRSERSQVGVLHTE